MNIPQMCLWCGDREVQIVTDADGAGFCSEECDLAAATVCYQENAEAEVEWCNDPERNESHKLGTDGSCHTCAMSKDSFDGEPSDGFTDSEADADVLRSAGMGTDEDYGYFGGDDD